MDEGKLKISLSVCKTVLGSFQSSKEQGVADLKSAFKRKYSYAWLGIVLRYCESLGFVESKPNKNKKIYSLTKSGENLLQDESIRIKTKKDKKLVSFVSEKNLVLIQTYLFWFGSLTFSQLLKLTGFKQPYLSLGLKNLFINKKILVFKSIQTKNFRLFCLTAKAKNALRVKEGLEYKKTLKADKPRWLEINHKDKVIDFIQKHNLEIGEQVILERKIIDKAYEEMEKLYFSNKKKFVEYKKRYSQKPDLVAIDDFYLNGKSPNEKIFIAKQTAIEIEITFKSKDRYRKIFKNYFNLIEYGTYKKVVYFCSSKVYKKFEDIENSSKKIPNSSIINFRLI